MGAGESVSIQITANLASASVGVYTNKAYANASNANKVDDDASVTKTDVVIKQDVIAACEEYLWNGTLYTESGSYEFEGVNENGCPTIETLDLIINEPVSSEVTEEACGSYTWERTGEVFTESVIDEVRVFTGLDGECDETVTLNITIIPSQQISELCFDGFPYTAPWGEDFYESGIFARQLSAILCVELEITFDGEQGGPCYLLGEEGGTPTGIITADCGCGETTIEYDCPEIQANFGDSCDDGNPNTINDVINEDCLCEGTPVYDCEEIQANFGDPCDDGNPNTINDEINENCDCVGTLINECEADAGSVTFGDGSLDKMFCADDQVPSTFTFDTPVHWNTGLFTRGIITDASGNIIFITDDQVFVESYDFDIFGTGTFYLYVLNFDDSQSNIAELSAIFSGGGVVNIADFTGCYDLSNQLVVVGDDSPLSGEETVAACESFIWNGMDLDVSGDYDFDFPGSNGACDSTATLHLTISLPTESSEEVASCNPYEWKGTIYTETGLYSYVDESGVCPHTFYLDLTIGGDGCNVEGDCINFSTYYVSHGSGIVGSNIYKVNFVGTDAILNFNFNVDYSAHMAIDAQGGIAYLVNEDGSGLEAYNLIGAPSSLGVLALEPGLSHVVNAVFNPTDGLVYIGDMDVHKIYTIDPNGGTGALVFYANAPVSGGDIAFQNGELYLATKTGNKLYKVVQNGVAIPVANIPAKVNGIAAANNNTDLFVSNFGATQIYQVTAATGAVQNSFDVILDGEIYMLQNGDLASGCGDNKDIVKCYGAEVVAFNQGPLMNGNPVPADRSDANKALGEPDRINAAGGFVSLGVGGSITIAFEGIVNNGPGNDIKIWETSFKGDVCGGAGDERADIELSSDGVNFFYVGTICLDGEVDMADVGLTSVSHIRITNAATTTTPDGYDLDGVEAIYGCSNNPIIVNGECYATEVVEYVQGVRHNGGAIATDRTDPSKALGAPERSDAMNFVALGYGGSIILAFSSKRTRL